MNSHNEVKNLDEVKSELSLHHNNTKENLETKHFINGFLNLANLLKSQNLIEYKNNKNDENEDSENFESIINRFYEIKNQIFFDNISKYDNNKTNINSNNNFTKVDDIDTNLSEKFELNLVKMSITKKVEIDSHFLEFKNVLESFKDKDEEINYLRRVHSSKRLNLWRAFSFNYLEKLLFENQIILLKKITIYVYNSQDNLNRLFLLNSKSFKANFNIDKLDINEFLDMLIKIIEIIEDKDSNENRYSTFLKYFCSNNFEICSIIYLQLITCEFVKNNKDISNILINCDLDYDLEDLIIEIYYKVIQQNDLNFIIPLSLALQFNINLKLEIDQNKSSVDISANDNVLCNQYQVVIEKLSINQKFNDDMTILFSNKSISDLKPFSYDQSNILSLNQFLSEKNKIDQFFNQDFNFFIIYCEDEAQKYNKFVKGLSNINSNTLLLENEKNKNDEKNHSKNNKIINLNIENCLLCKKSLKECKKIEILNCCFHCAEVRFKSEILSRHMAFLELALNTYEEESYLISDLHYKSKYNFIVLSILS